MLFLILIVVRISSHSRSLSHTKAIYPVQTAVLCVASNDFMDEQMPELFEKLMKFAKVNSPPPPLLFLLYIHSSLANVTTLF